MKKLMLLFMVVAGLGTVKAQNGDYFFSKTVTVGCYNANPLTDMTKKITISIKDGVATATIASINCSKSFEAISLGKFSGKGDAFFDAKEGRGIIIEDNTVLYYFKKENDAYNILAVAHTDKKVAKTLTIETGTSTYAAAFSDIDKLLAGAKAEKEAAEKAAATLPIPEGNYSDEYGISGLYYLSEASEILNYGPSKPAQYVAAVQLELCKSENYLLKAHYAEGKFDKFYVGDRDLLKALNAGQKLQLNFFDADNMNYISAFHNTDIRFVEEGVWVVEVYGYFTNKLDCSIPEYYPKKDKAGTPIKKFFLIGKNKDRIAELANDYDKVVELAGASTIANCQQSNALEAANNPMPAEGMKDAQLKADATAVIKARSIQAHWAQTVDYVYITSTEWFTIRNNNTGIIVGRSVRGVVVMKTTAGNCQWEEVVIKQDYNGSTYGKSYYGGETQIIVPVDCNEAKKYK